MYRKIANKYGSGCLMILREADKESYQFACSGFVCHAQGYILTCAHSLNLTDRFVALPPQPIEEFNQLTLKKIHPINVKIVQYDPINDVALLKVVDLVQVSFHDIIFENEHISQVGSSVGYLGYPFGHSGLHTLKVSQSIISSKVKSRNGTKQYQIDALVHEGNSGGPLVDLQTEKVIGVISGRFSPVGDKPSVKIGDYALGSDSSISFATSIDYGIELMRNEGLDV